MSSKSKSAIPPIDESEKHACWVLYMGGFNTGEILKRVGCNINNLEYWIRTGGWAKDRKEILEANRAKNPPGESAMVKVFSPDKKAENVKTFLEKTGEMAVSDAKHWADSMNPDERLAVGPSIAALNKAHRSNLDLDKEEAGERGHISLTFLNSTDAVRVIDIPSKELERAS